MNSRFIRLPLRAMVCATAISGEVVDGCAVKGRQVGSPKA